MKKAIVTGANGFIGHELCKTLSNYGVKTYAVLRNEKSYTYELKKLKYVVPIFCDADTIINIKNIILDESIDVFYHLVWGGISGDSRADYLLQLNSIRWMMDAVDVASRIGCKRFVGAGTLAEFDVYNYVMKDGSTPNLVCNYGSSKICAHQMTKALCNNLNMEHIWAYISNTYGEKDTSANFINYAINLFESNKEANFTKGEQWYDFVHVSDIAEGLYCVGEAGRNNFSYYIGSGQPQKLRGFVEQIRDIVCPDREINFGAVPYNGISASLDTFDCSKISEHTGYKPKVKFADGIRSLQFFRNDIRRQK